MPEEKSQSFMIYMVNNMKKCEICEREYSSDGSYRVHRHRFHRNLEPQQPMAIQNAMQETAKPELVVSEIKQPDPKLIVKAEKKKRLNPVRTTAKTKLKQIEELVNFEPVKPEAEPEEGFEEPEEKEEPGLQPEEKKEANEGTTAHTPSDGSGSDLAIGLGLLGTIILGLVLKKKWDEDHKPPFG